MTFWGMGREGEVVGELLPLFMREHPDIRVSVQMLPWTAAHERLLTAYVGGSLPDIAQLGNTWIPEFASIHALETLDELVAASTVIDQNDYFSGTWNTNEYGGALYGVPWYVDTRLMFYRRDIVEQAGFRSPPTNWSEWMQVLMAVKRTVGADNYAILLPLNEFEPLLALGLQQDEPLLRENGTLGNFRSVGFKRALTYYLNMFTQGLAPLATNTQISNVYDEFNRGFFSFYITGPWNIGEFGRRLPAERQHIWATAPLPGPEGPGASIAGGSSLVLFRESRRKPAAWTLLEFLSRPDIQAQFHALTGDLPPRRQSWRAATLADDAHARAFQDQLERVRAAPAAPEWERIAQELRIVGEFMVRGELTVDGAAQELDARADRILEKRRWLVARGRAA